jgi:hypothetical protein
LTKGRAISTSVVCCCALEEESPLAVGLLFVLMDMLVYVCVCVNGIVRKRGKKESE